MTAHKKLENANFFFFFSLLHLIENVLKEKNAQNHHILNDGTHECLIYVMEGYIRFSSADRLNE